MIAYVTYNDPPSGIYLSQVVDVVNYYKSLKKPMKLIAFFSMRTYWKDRKRLKEMYPDAIALPCFPGVKNWRKSIPLLKLYLKKNKVNVGIGRGVFATDLLLRSKLDHVVFDARGAYYGEWLEFKFGADDKFINAVFELEKEVLQNANFKIAVSNALVNYWKETYELTFSDEEISIIPCTLSNSTFSVDFNVDENNTERLKYGYTEEDIVLVYAGSIAGWQSIDYWLGVVEELMNSNDKVKLLLLTQYNTGIQNFISKYPTRVQRFWVKPEEVSELMSLADYGILLREQMITNKVASPTKFAEYLAAGLKVLISKELGDYSNFVANHKVGLVLGKNDKVELLKPSKDQKVACVKIAKNHFTKSNYALEYLKVVEK